MFIIDFDDTLFNTHHHKFVRLNSLKERGVTEEDYWDSYKKARVNKNGIFTNSNNQHAKILSEMGYEEENMLEGLNSTTGKMLEELVLPGAEEFLKELKSYNKPMILLSLGDPDYQELKVNGSGLAKYFDKRFMVADSKRAIVQELLKNVKQPDVWFINDKITETKEIFTFFPQINPLLKVSPKISIEEYKKSELPHFHKLEEIKLYVRKAHS